MPVPINQHNLNNNNVSIPQSGGPDNVLASVTENGSLYLHSLQDGPSQLLHFKHSSELTKCCSLSERHVVSWCCNTKHVAR